MRIKRIEFENFRNFREKGRIDCATDGRVTIVYGKNGDGKTTLHQLLQWVLYGSVHFNKTTTDRLYNLQFEAEQPTGSEFDVIGRIDFEHAGQNYVASRIATYQKNLIGISAFASEKFELLVEDDDHNMKIINKPVDAIEKLLPSGLAEYFFFDGESMIADLRVKGADSARKLRAALYSMFDLDILDAAIDQIGDTDHKKTVIGKLYLSKGEAAAGSEIAALRMTIEQVQEKIERLQKDIENASQSKKSNQELIQRISEQIGSSKSKEEYEARRNELERQSKLCEKNMLAAQQAFGDEVIAAYPRLLLAKAIADAKSKIHLKVENSKLPIGLSKPLIAYLLNSETTTCLCGNPLCEESREHIRAFLDLMPPKSYASLYHEFITTARNWGDGNTRQEKQERIEQYILSAVENNEQMEIIDSKILEEDAIQKKSADISELVIARQEAEKQVKVLDERISRAMVELAKFRVHLKKLNKDFTKLTEADSATAIANRKIAIMEKVKADFEERLSTASNKYSTRLQENITGLLKEMLTTEREVSVSSSFEVKVYDSHGDESKSEGQFAVVSFAYIGGILKLLKSEERLAGKEYPLVLDGPFSKLDQDQRQNVVDTIPSFAPQVILFSKDSLQDVIDLDRVGRIYTIKSNAEKNEAVVKEGFLWS